MIFNKFFKTTLAIATVAMFTVSCNKDNNVAPLDLTNETAAIACGYEYPVLGKVGSPYDPSSFGNVYVTLGSSSATQDTVYSSGAQLIFTNRVNSFVINNDDYELGILGSETNPEDICSISASAWADVDIITSPAGTGVWYTYVSQVATPIPGVVLLVRDSNNPSDIWAFTLESATAATISSSPLLIQGTNTINVRKL